MGVAGFPPWLPVVEGIKVAGALPWPAGGAEGGGVLAVEKRWQEVEDEFRAFGSLSSGGKN